MGLFSFFKNKSESNKLSKSDIKTETQDLSKPDNMSVILG
ncbi:MAG: hypothetical protein ACI81T_002950 [Bacteroidia bacterium]|jgi:hypothetical protein